jgi:hypothetical protein
MYRGKVNTKGYRERRRSMKTTAQLAVYIAESIRARQTEGRSYELDDYGLGDKPELIELVARALGVIS